MSGLDDVGQVVPGRNEIYDPATKSWSPVPSRYFPTYPSFFVTGKGEIFYSGSNAGYGPADKGCEPGLWNLADNTFTPVGGLKDPDVLETSSFVLLPPAQDRKVMVLGGGGVGSRGYRGRGASDILRSQIYDPAKNDFTPAAAPTVGRNYHTEALLLPDGRIAVFGSDPLFDDKANSRAGHFEQRVEVFEPPYLHHGKKPQLAVATESVDRGSHLTMRSADAGRIERVRLIRPGSATHVTDFDQRSIALDVIRRDKDGLTTSVPGDNSLVPSGWYMVFATDRSGVPSQAAWVRVR